MPEGGDEDHSRDAGGRVKLAILLPLLATADQTAEAERAAAVLREEGHEGTVTNEAEFRAAARPTPDRLELHGDLLADLHRDFPPPRTDRAWRRRRIR